MRLNKRVISILTAGLIFASGINSDFINEKSIKAASVVYGDVNCDKVVNINDLILLKGYFLDSNIKGFNLAAADIADDGEVTVLDLFQLYRYLMGEAKNIQCDFNKDSDKDQLPDFIEVDIYNTDPAKSDTDGDGISDYQEIMITHTDPLTPDKSYLKEDADKDGLSNEQELKMGTDPNESDSDGDKLSDYEETSKYKTDPLKSDSDEDSVSDFEEIKIGTDPLKEKSDGKSTDSNRVFEQKISANNSLLAEVNSDDNYSLSISVTSAGYAEDHISVGRSGYTKTLTNEFVIGDIIDIDYSDFTVETCTVYFEVDNNADHYCICKYIKEINALLPVETKYDENTLSFTDDGVGTYCLIDVNKWISDSETATSYLDEASLLGSSSGISKSCDIMFVKYYTSGNSFFKIDETIVDDECKPFIITDGDEYKEYRYHQDAQRLVSGYITSIIKNAKDNDINVNIYCFDADGQAGIYNSKYKDITKAYVDADTRWEDIYTTSNYSSSSIGYDLDVNYFDLDIDYSKVDKKLLIRKPWSICGTLWSWMAGDTLYYQDNAGYYVSFPSTIRQNNGRKKYVIFLDNGMTPSCDLAEEAIDELKAMNVDISFYYNPGNPNAPRYEELATDNQAYIWNEKAPLDDILAKINNSEAENTYSIGTFGKRYRLCKAISASFAKKYLADKKSISESEMYDTDNDGIMDLDELCDVGSYASMMEKYTAAAKWFRNTFLGGKSSGTLIDDDVLFWGSNPTAPDSDEDGLLDGEGINKWDLSLADPEPNRESNFIAFGTKSYFNEVKRITDKNQRRTYIMNQVKTADYCDLIPFEYWDAFCTYFNSLVDVVDTKELHYFRNYLNRAPKTMDDLLMNEKDKWNLLNPEEAIYHMFDRSENDTKHMGAFNLKFVSKDGKYEAVYDINGQLLNEDNDPCNMGTYNYSDPGALPVPPVPFYGFSTGEVCHLALGHFFYDILPYTDECYCPVAEKINPEIGVIVDYILAKGYYTGYGWYNVEGQKINCSEANNNKLHYKESSEAQAHYAKIKSEMQ